MTGDLRAEKCQGIFMGKAALVPGLVMDQYLCAGGNACLSQSSGQGMLSAEGRNKG